MKNCIFILLFFLTIVNCIYAFGFTKITVATSANMQFVMVLIKKDFEEKFNIKIDLVVSSSGKLTAQIKEGAPYDVFISADMDYPMDLCKHGLTSDNPKIYATGQLVLWTVKKELSIKPDLKILLSSSVKKIAIANPKTAPYGLAAEQVLKYYKMYDKIKNKLVYGESIGQTQQFIATEAAEIGFISKSLVLAGDLIMRGNYIDIDEKSYSPISQCVVILKHGIDYNKDATEKFYQYLFSQKAKALFIKYGYIVN